MSKQKLKMAKPLTIADFSASDKTGAALNGEGQKQAIGVRGKKFRYTDFNTARNMARYALFLKNPKFYIGA